MEARGRSFQIEGVAQKRGFAVLTCSAHRTIIADRHFLREIQRQVRKDYHEHILIFHCDVPQKQVWTWSCQGADGRGVVHREHPFFSENPPSQLLWRLGQLAFRLEDEEQTSLVDVLSRVRAALIPEAESNLFATRPEYARSTERLAIAYRNGDESALPKLVYMHLLLAKDQSRYARLWFRLGEDDAQQIAVLGLIEAVKRFEPERGYQFSTYAVPWIRQACSRFGLQASQFIRIPSHLYWPCVKLERELRLLEQRTGPIGPVIQEQRRLIAAKIRPDFWERFRLSRELKLASNLPKSKRTVFHGVDPTTPVDVLARREVINAVLEELEQLPRRKADILKQRYGLEGPSRTLEEVAQPMRLTRERIRQLQDSAEKTLRARLIHRGVSLDDQPAEQPTFGDEHAAAKPDESQTEPVAESDSMDDEMTPADVDDAGDIMFDGDQGEIDFGEFDDATD